MAVNPQAPNQEYDDIDFDPARDDYDEEFDAVLDDVEGEPSED
jgi:hypothetical protein